MRRDSLLLLGLLTTICMIAGVVAGIQTGKIPPQASATTPRTGQTSLSAHTATPSPAPNLQPTFSAQQRALLIIGVADRSAPQPHFEGCWIVTFSPGIDKYYVLGFTPQARFHVNSLGRDDTMAEIYTEDVQQAVDYQQQAVDYQFVRDAIHSVFPAMTVQAVVTVDRSDLVNLTSNLGGIAIGGRVLMGGSLTAAYDTQLFKGNDARMAFQSQMFQALFQALGDQHWSPASVAAYLQQIPHAVHPDAALTQLANGAPSLQNSELIWTVVGGEHAAAQVP